MRRPARGRRFALAEGRCESGDGACCTAKSAHDYNGVFPEKYNVVTGSYDLFVEYGSVGTKFSYIAPEGFGWINASFEVGMNYLSPAQWAALRESKPPSPS